MFTRLRVVVSVLALVLTWTATLAWVQPVSVPPLDPIGSRFYRVAWVSGPAIAKIEGTARPATYR